MPHHMMPYKNLYIFWFPKEPFIKKEIYFNFHYKESFVEWKGYMDVKGSS